MLRGKNLLYDLWLKRLKNTSFRLTGKMWMTRNKKKIEFKSAKLRNNKNRNYECLFKRMLYCPGSGHELLSALGVCLICHATRFFLVLKPPLSMMRSVFKVNRVIVWPGMICNPWSFGRCFDTSEMFLFSGVESLACLSNVAPCTNNWHKEFFYTTFVLPVEDCSSGSRFSQRSFWNFTMFYPGCAPSVFLQKCYVRVLYCNRQYSARLTF